MFVVSSSKGGSTRTGERASKRSSASRTTAKYTITTASLDKDDIESVAYIHFKSQEAVTRFAQAYQGHVFRSKQGKRIGIDVVLKVDLQNPRSLSGQQSHVIVEYAPFQKIPLKAKKVDALAGTIDEGALGPMNGVGLG